jgi:kynureninase
MRRVLFRLHDWLADHVSWVQYPRWRPAPPGPGLVYWWQRATYKQRSWVVFAAFWGLAVLLAVYGNVID